MALTWTWDENIPKEKKQNKKSDEMVQRFVLLLANESKTFTPTVRNYVPEYSSAKDEKTPVDVRPQWKIDNEARFKKHVAEMEEWLDATGMRNHPSVGSAFNRFVQWTDPETAAEFTYYNKGDALRDYDDYEDFMCGY